MSPCPNRRRQCFSVRRRVTPPSTQGEIGNSGHITNPPDFSTESAASTTLHLRVPENGIRETSGDTRQGGTASCTRLQQKSAIHTPAVFPDTYFLSGKPPHIVDVHLLPPLPLPFSPVDATPAAGNISSSEGDPAINQNDAPSTNKDEPSRNKGAPSGDKMDVEDDQPQKGPEPVDYDKLPTSLKTIFSFDRWMATTPADQHDFLSNSSNLSQVVQAETDKANALAKETIRANLQAAADKADKHLNEMRNRLVKHGKSLDKDNERIVNQRSTHAARARALKAKHKAELDAAAALDAKEVRTAIAKRDEARAVFEKQETAVSHAADEATAAKRKVQAFDNPGKQKKRPKRSNKSTTQGGTTAPTTDHPDLDTEVLEFPDPPIDINIQMPDTLRSKGARHIHLTVEDEPYYNTNVEIISKEGPAAWPKRFHQDIQDTATILLMQFDKDSRPSTTINAAAAGLKHGVEEGGDVDTIVKMSIALSELLTHLRAAASNRHTNAAPWSTKQLDTGDWITVPVKKRPPTTSRKSSDGGRSSSSFTSPSPRGGRGSAPRHATPSHHHSESGQSSCGYKQNKRKQDGRGWARHSDRDSSPRRGSTGRPRDRHSGTSRGSSTRQDRSCSPHRSRHGHERSSSNRRSSHRGDSSRRHTSARPRNGHSQVESGTISSSYLGTLSHAEQRELRKLEKAGERPLKREKKKPNRKTPQETKTQNSEPSPASSSASDDSSDSSGYELVSRKVWDINLSGSILPIGAFFWYKAMDSLWWLGKVSGNSPASDSYLVRFPDDPGPVRITLAPPLYDTAAAAKCGSWCLQVHRNGNFMRGIRRNSDESR